MSGLEVAGLVLGAFPVACSVAKQAGLTLSKAKDWWQFKRTFENFVSALSTQEIAYIQVLKRLLEPLDISDEEYNSLLKTPALWNDAHIQEGLRTRLSDTEHYWVSERLADLEQTIRSVQGLLPDAGLYDFDSKSLDHELYRLQMSFSSEKDELLERMTTINDELHQFLERATVVNRQAASKPKVPFKELQSQAIKFYDCLAVRWRSCCCPSAHTLGITAHIPSRSLTKNGQLKVAFEHGGEIKQVRIGVEEVVKAYMKAPQQPSQQQLNVNKDDFDPEAAGRMRRHMKTEKQKVAATPDKDKSVSVLQVAASHEAKPASRSILRRAAGKLRKSWKTTIPAVASHSVPSRVRFEVVSSSTVNTSACGVEVEGAVVETEAEAETEADVDMCQFATWTFNATSEGASTEDSYSVLRSEDLKIILRQESMDQSQLQASRTQTMDSFLGSMPLRFSRLAVGLRFALTLLSLSTSPWVPKELEKGDLFLISSTDKKTIPLGPYLSRSSRDIDSTKSSGGTWHAKSSLLLLGIVLLELFFGEPLERQPSWTESLVDGRLNEYTRFFSAFQWACLADDSLKQCFGRDLGGSLSEAIRKCIQFDFGRESEYGDSRFAEVVYKEVVVPLEKCCPI